VPDEVTGGLSTVAIRIPSHPVARALLTTAAIAVAAPSANLFSRPSPTRASHVLDDLASRIDLVVDGGSTDVGLESTVLDLSGDVPTILRPGAISIEMLREILPRVERRSSAVPAEGATPSPGMLERHYAPRAPLTVFDGHSRDAVARLVREACEAIAAGQRVGIMAADEDRAALSEVAQSGSHAIVVYLGCASSMRPASTGFSPAPTPATMASLSRFRIACAAPGLGSDPAHWGQTPGQTRRRTDLRTLSVAHRGSDPADRGSDPALTGRQPSSNRARRISVTTRP
jgi:hypothetical protein